MKKVVSFSLLLSSLSLLNACANQGNYDTTIRSWQGASQPALYRTWGQPNSTEKSTQGNTVLVYQQQEQERTNPSTSSINNSPLCYAFFEIGQDGKVLNATSRGSNCTANQNFVITHFYNGMN